MIHKPVCGYKGNKCINDTTSTKVTMNDKPIKQVTSIKFLGIVLNDKLTRENHKKLLQTNISKTFGCLYECNKIMNENNCIDMYKTFIEPDFIYAIEACGHSIQSENDLLIKLQSKIMRILFNCYRTAVLKQLKINTSFLSFNF